MKRISLVCIYIYIYIYTDTYVYDICDVYVCVSISNLHTIYHSLHILYKIYYDIDIYIYIEIVFWTLDIVYHCIFDIR